MADEQAPAPAPAAVPKEAKMARAKHWQQVIGVSDAEHEATLISGKIRVNVDLTKGRYQSAFNRWRKGPA